MAVTPSLRHGTIANGVRFTDGDRGIEVPEATDHVVVDREKLQIVSDR
jgi:hypothetical protein